MEAELSVQMDNQARIVKALANFKKSPKPRITEMYCQTRLESLENLWSDFTTMHKKLIGDYNDEIQGDDYIKNDIYDVTEETYIEYKTLLKTSLQMFVKESDRWSDAREKSVPETSNKESFKLPKIVIPNFSGKYTEWITFRDLFMSLIHNNPKLDKVQKMHYLKSSLSGEAEQLLRQIPISEANYERCWSQLKTRYNNKRYLSHFILKRLLSQKNIVVESANALKELIDTTNDCLSGLTNLGINITNWDIIIIHILCLKLDSESRKQWEFNITDSTSSEELPTFEQFKEFLTNRYRALEFLDTKVVSNRSNYSINSNQNQNTTVKFKALHVAKAQCEFCSDTHKLSMCRKFASRDVNHRRNFIQTSGLCFICLGANHGAKACQNKLKCKLCHRRHHTLLHPTGTEKYSPHANCVEVESDGKDSSNGIGPHSEAGNVEKSTFVACSFSTGNVKQVLLATALVNAESRNGSHQVLRALLDQGSQGNFVTESTANDLKLKRTPIQGKISGVGGDKSLVSKAIVTLNIKSRSNPNNCFTVQAYVLKSITSFLPNRKLAQLDFAALEGIELADPEYNRPNKIDLLLGAEVYSQVLQEGIRKVPNGSLVAQATSLGWILSGTVSSPVNQTGEVLALHCQLQEGDELLKKFWELETGNGLTKEQSYTEEEKKCEEIFSKTTTRDKEGRYVVRLPFKTEDPECKRGDTRDIAEKRLKSLERRFEKNEKLKDSYKAVIDEYIKMGHIVEVSEPDKKRKESVYLPHHAVIREDKDTTKVRVVFNASQAGKNGVSLNDDLLVGPTIQPDLRHLILQWRLSRICLTADIIKMYRQVKVHEDDTDFQRLLWRDEQSGEIKDYKHLRVTFGTASAPFLAVKALQQVAIDEGAKYPVAAEKVADKFYMDDLMCGCEEITEGLEIYKQMKGLLGKAGFELQKWASNDEELMDLIKTEENMDRKEKGNQHLKEGIHIKMDEIMKILGLTWERCADYFRYKVNLPDLKLPLTKRKIIADISRLFDPLGWITPCIIVAKVMIQKLWITGVGWDDEAPTEIIKEWCTYREELLSLSDIKIPRWAKTRANDIKRELHGFCDASKTAYAAVVYLRVIDSDGEIQVTLVAAKSKVAPIKQISIPRLELCGAVELTRLLIDVGKILKIESRNIHAWTDSTIVLAWLNSLPSRWKVFVANRVSEILTSTNPHQWAHVSTNENPADCASRGVTPGNLRNQSLWFDGPKFLQYKEIVYKKPTVTPTEIEAVKVHTIKKEEGIWDVFERFSSLTKLIRVLAYCRRFLQLRKSKSGDIHKHTGYLKSKELRETLEVCIKRDQENYFGEEIEIIKKNLEIKRNSCLKSLNPILDNNNIIRVGGRLEEAYLKPNRKHPIIMAKSSRLTALIIADAHKQTLHGGPQLTLNYLQSKYFIIGAKQLVKSHVRKCIECVKNSGRTSQQLMGQLPSVRVTPSRPFLHSGVDFAGPIQMRTSRGRGHKSYKGYICLFVCMSTKAVHIEAVSDLTAQGFLQAFKRFVARRGRCEDIWSDNGTNFVGAATEIRKLFADEKNGILPEVAEMLANNHTSWHFIPPHSPNFGGLWEAGIKSVKHHLKRVIGTSTLTYEEMSTVLAQVEACLNSRPLSRLDGDQDKVEVLTPGHFLVGEAIVTAPDVNYENSNVNSLRRWQYTQRMSQEFWRKWSQEYLNQYFHRYRWATQKPQPKTGDIVLIKEDGLPPCRWLYGKIIEIHPGRDGITRVVTLKSKNSFIKRPVSKLCVLPVTE